ncbi:MAG: hypothetical protein NTZ74_05600 [Chloroflexi bacterium]|nr:hypothetical protein [Chloroflexota bacterium]
MKIMKLNCTACGAPISVPDDLVDIFFCNSCGSKLAVDRGEGYVALKVLEKITQTILDSGEKTHYAINENTFVTRTELKKVQISQSIGTEEMKLNSLRQEIRQLSRKLQLSSIESLQLTNLRLDESNSLIQIRKLHLEIARLNEDWKDSPEVLQTDLASLDEIIALLSPFSKEPPIAARISELTQERTRCQQELFSLETEFITKQLRTYKHPPVDALGLDQLERLRDDIQEDLNWLKSEPQTEVKKSILEKLDGLRAELDAIFPRRKVESTTGELRSLDLHPPFPEIPWQLIPLIDLADRDLAQIKTSPASPSKIIIQTEIEMLSKQLRKRQALDIPSRKIRSAKNKKRGQLVALVLILLLIASTLVILLVNGKSNLSLIESKIRSELSNLFQPRTSTKTVGQYQQINTNFLEIVALKTYLRLEPNLNSTEIGELNHHDIVFDLGRDSQATDWYKVELPENQTVGYLYEQWVMPLHGSSINASPMVQTSTQTIYEQKFSQPTNGWGESSFDEYYGTGNRQITGGSYRIELNSKMPAFYYSNSEITDLPGTYLISVDTKWLEGKGSGYFGLQTNIIDETNFNFAMISSEGYLVVGVVRNNKSFLFYNSQDSPNTNVPFFNGDKNTLSASIQAESNTGSAIVTYSLNGYAFYSIELEGLQEYQPRIGLIVYLFAADESVIASFDNITVTN